MSVEICVSKNSFSVMSCFSENLLSLIKTYNERYWDGKRYQWILPINDYQDFLNKIKSSNITYNTLNNVPSILSITNTGDNLQVQFNKIVQEYDLIRTLTNASYNKAEKLINIPISEKSALLNVLRKADIRFTYKDEKEVEKEEIIDKKVNKRTTKRKINIAYLDKNPTACFKINKKNSKMVKEAYNQIKNINSNALCNIESLDEPSVNKESVFKTFQEYINQTLKNNKAFNIDTSIETFNPYIIESEDVEKYMADDESEKDCSLALMNVSPNDQSHIL